MDGVVAPTYLVRLKLKQWGSKCFKVEDDFFLAF